MLFGATLRFGALRLAVALRFGAAALRLGAAALRLAAALRFGAALRLAAALRLGAAALRLAATLRFGAAALRLAATFLFGAAFLFAAFFLTAMLLSRFFRACTFLLLVTDDYTTDRTDLNAKKSIIYQTTFNKLFKSGDMALKKECNSC